MTNPQQSVVVQFSLIQFLFVRSLASLQVILNRMRLLVEVVIGIIVISPDFEFICFLFKWTVYISTLLCLCGEFVYVLFCVY